MEVVIWNRGWESFNFKIRDFTVWIKKVEFLEDKFTKVIDGVDLTDADLARRNLERETSKR